MHHILEMLSDLLTNWPVTAGKREKNTRKDRKKISTLHYKPICKITTDQKSNDMPQKDEAN